LYRADTREYSAHSTPIGADRRVVLSRLGRARGQGNHASGHVPLALGRHRVVPPMRRALTARAFFFYVNDFARAAQVAIPSDDATARQRGKADESHHAHDRASVDAQSNVRTLLIMQRMRAFRRGDRPDCVKISSDRWYFVNGSEGDKTRL
jgi:hypothetical protein